MSDQSTNTQGTLKTRYLTFTQQVPNPLTSNVQNNPYGNIVRISFPYPQGFRSAELALATLYMYYSWYNITAAFGNNTFAYKFPTLNSGYVTFNVTIPDGFYSIDELNQIFQQIQNTNGTYLIDTNGNPIYFLYFVANATFYRTTLFSNVIPGGGSGYTVPANYPGGGPPASNQSPTMTFLPTSYPAGSNTPGFYSFSKTLGYLPGDYPTVGTTTSQSYNGQYVPIIESTTSVGVACSIANSSAISSQPQVFYSFSPNTSFGSQIQVQPPVLLWVPVTDGSYPFIDIAFYDSNNNLLNMQDASLSGSIIIRGP